MSTTRPGRSGLARLLDVDAADAEVRHHGRNALVVFYGVILLGVPSLVALWFIPHGPVLTATILVFLLVAVFATSLVRRGEVRAGVSVFFVAMLAVFAVFPVVGQDARLSAVYLVVPVAIAGVTLGRVGVAVVTGAALVIAVGMTWRYPPVDPPPGTVEIIIAAVTLVLFVLVTALLGQWGLRREVRRAEALARSLGAANAELEDRVAARTDDLERALTRQEVLVAELAEISVRDSLTGLHNRRHADDELPRLASHAERYGHPLSLAMADLDHFKTVNDDHSYLVGDEVLRRFARLLSQTGRSADLVARYGGEEFLLAMPETTLAQAQVVCERLRRAVADYDWAAISPGLQVTVSIGIADDAAHGGLVTLLSSVDRALHEAKRTGRNRLVPAPAQVDAHDR